ncbi:MAG: ParB N-terminal domain-containing protein [Chloroflexi bacterium]|jgi:ParB-like chromosome segregation protein Spo0J|nr:ParB N-terminal domain-containing protein [Chloroflexota bacterium]
MTRATGPAGQPISHVEWVDPLTLRANDYNPNRVARPELALLKLSLMENGWTQPIVARVDGEIVDGFHRWTLARTDAEVAALTGGLVPVVRLPAIDPATQRMATIRHNRARGSHHVLRMADIIADLHGMGLADGEIGRRLGMDPEEVGRLLDRGNMLKRGAGAAFSKGWTTADPDALPAEVRDMARGSVRGRSVPKEAKP